MRVVDTLEKEDTIRCPACKKMLAYTQQDVIEMYSRPMSTTDSVRVRRYIQCPVCYYETWLEDIEI